MDWSGPLKSTIESIDSGTKLLTTTDKLKVDIPFYTELKFRDSDQNVVGWHTSNFFLVNVDGTLTYLYSTDAYGGSNTFAWMTVVIQ